jgi:hypothetical protein
MQEHARAITLMSVGLLAVAATADADMSRQSPDLTGR